VDVGDVISTSCMFCKEEFEAKIDGVNEEGMPVLSKRVCKCGAYFFFDYYYPSLPVRGFEELDTSIVYHYPIFFRIRRWLVLVPTLQLVAQRFMGGR